MHSPCCTVTKQEAELYFETLSVILKFETKKLDKAIAFTINLEIFKNMLIWLQRIICLPPSKKNSQPILN